MYDALSDGSGTPERQRIIFVEGQDLGVSFEQTVMRCVDISEITFSNESSESILFASNKKLEVAVTSAPCARNLPVCRMYDLLG